MGIVRRALGIVTGVFLVVGTAAAVYLCYWLYTLFTAPLHPAAGPFNRTQMEEIVAQVRAQKFEGYKNFWWIQATGTTDVLTGTTPGPWKEGSPPTLLVIAERYPDKTLKVVIVTSGGGRGGSAGYAYSDVPLQLSPDPSAEQAGVQGLDLPGFLYDSSAGMKIDEHWWQVFQNGS